MFKVTLPADRVVIDMAAVAEAFGISVNDLEDDMQIGKINRWFEVGDGDEGNKPHQIFDSQALGIRVNVDEIGNVRSSNKSGTVSAAVQPHRSVYSGADRIRDSMEETLAADIQGNPDAARRAHLSALLDEALDESFPASDPVAISFESPHRAAGPAKKV